MVKLNNLLNDLSKHETSFRNIEKTLLGTYLYCNDFHSEENDCPTCYYFNGFTRTNWNNLPSWKIEVRIYDIIEDKEYGYRGENYTMIKQKVYEIIIGLANMDDVLKKINQY
mgnify:CR=1 FL=1|jgi:hypothetical protein|tara:strand:- start:90 stop:425 length:336 start_codon:yes stop_codon:yes gene_type:complete